MSDKHELPRLLEGCRSALWYSLGLSCLINILMLTIPLYMLQVFDRVLPSQSQDTLIYLTLIAIAAIAVLGLLDAVRALVMTRMGMWIDHRLSPAALSKSIDHTLAGGLYGAQSLADITTLRQFLSSAGIYAFFDAPWVFIYLVVIFILDSSLGLLSMVGAIILFILTLLNEKVSRAPLKHANLLHMHNQESIHGSLKNAEAIQAMGMMNAIIDLWSKKNSTVLELQRLASDHSGMVLSFSKSMRMALQILMLAAGAYLVVKGELTSGAMLAASIILSRALAPIEQSIGVWKQALGARQAYQRLEHYFDTAETRPNTILLPHPKGQINVENVLFIPAGLQKPILQNISFMLHPGASMAIVGRSGCGKSTLARLLVGVWRPNTGSVRLDGADVYEWNRTDIGQHIGYLPQNIALFSGSVKENIARMEHIDESHVIAAAKFVDAHDMILHLEHGYETEIANYNLSGGQRQLIALTRAFYGLPRLVVLDEPESHLDEIGIQALDIAIKRARSAGITIVMITQRHDCANFCEKIYLIDNGYMTQIGHPHHEAPTKT